MLAARAKAQKLDQLEVQVADFTKMLLPNSIDLLNASYSLPFISPDKFSGVWDKLTQRIATGGLFTGNFFAPEDDYARYKNITVFTQTQLDALFIGFKFLYLVEDKEVSPDSTGVKKQWDIWQIVAIKN